jgi:hypothetical protein
MSAVRRALPIALAVIALGALLALPASATSAGRNSTRIVVSLKFPAFHGTVVSPAAACIANRTVKLYRVRSGPDKLLGRDTSGNGGAWSIPIGKRLISGGYYAKATARGNCRAGKSKVNFVD